MGKVIKILVVLVAVLIAALAAIIFTIDVNQYKGKIVQAVQTNTGRDFQINGELKLVPSLVPTVAVEGVSFGNAPWADAAQMLSVGRFEAEVALLPLLKKNIQVKRLLLVEPRIHLETDKNGRGNWLLETGPEDTGQTPAEPAAAVELPALAINEIRIERANIRYVDGKTAKTTEVFIEEITVNSAGFSDEIAIVAEASVNQTPLSLSATLGSLDALLGNRDYPITLNVNLAGAKLDLDGRLAEPLAARGLNMQVSLEIDKLSDLNPVAGSAWPGTGPIRVNGALSQTGTGYALKPFSARILENELSGEAEINLAGARPGLIAELSSPELDLSPFQTREQETARASDSAPASASGAAAQRVFPSDPLPLTALKAADVALKFKTGALITRNLIINDLDLTLKLNNGKLRITPLTAGLAGGSLKANMGLDASSGDSALWDHAVEFRQIEPGQLPGIKEKQLLSGAKTDISSKGKGAGASVSAIMAGLDGKLLIKTGKGRITARALESSTANALLGTLALLNPSAGRQDARELECAVINLDIKDGIAVADNGIGIATGQMNVLGAGNINLKTETLDLGITPRAKAGAGLNAGQLAGLVRLRGTLAAPSPETDTQAALQAGLEAGSAVAAGGWSALTKGFLGNAGAGQNPCDIALGITPLETTASPDTPKNTLEQTTDTVKEAAEALGETLKKLF